MKLHALELHRADIPLVRPFRTSFGTQNRRDVLLVRAVTDVGEGWGECVALPWPLYSAETTGLAGQVIREHLAARLFAAGDLLPADVAAVLRPIQGHRMAKAAVEAALLDAWLRADGRSFASFLGVRRTRVPCGVSVGIADTIPALLDEVAAYLEAGYRRIKLKIQPGWDTEPVRAVREAFGPDVPLQVDANAAYGRGDIPLLRRLDEFDLLLVEQPFGEEALLAHADLAAVVSTPVCLDESAVSAEVVADAIRLRAADVINIKPGRVGGYLESVRIHEVCRAHGVPVWCGGMLETGIGRAANAALAGLDGFTLPGDNSASDRFYGADVVQAPMRMVDGHLQVPDAPGMGFDIDAAALDAVTTGVEVVTP